MSKALEKSRRLRVVISLDLSTPRQQFFNVKKGRVGAVSFTGTG